MAFFATEGSEPIPGYFLVNRLGTGGYGEVWKATAPGGLTKAIKIIYGHQRDARAAQEFRALTRIKEVRHPFLLSLERFEVIDDQVFIVTELADATLLNRFEECRLAGLPGIPRDELLGYLRDSADALDYMNEGYGLQHLDIKPQNLLLVGGRIKVADFGLVKDLRGMSATVTGGVTPLYASPEAFDGQVSRFSDQYSLAIVYQEMLTGCRPFPGKTALQLATQHMSSPPMLETLPSHDRPVIGRALAKEPEQRYFSCRAMADALVKASPPRPAAFPEQEIPVSGSDEIPLSIPSKAELPTREEILNLDTLVSPESIPQKKPGRDTPGRRWHPPQQVPERLTPRSVKPPPRPIGVIPQGGSILQPTLFLGIGGLAAWTIRRLRRRLHLRFGHLAAVPIYRLLLLDTDGAAIRQVQKGVQGEALPVEETLLVPLRRPEHYRAESRELLRWLDRRYLYNLPHSQLTEGYRPLGRLAFIDNAVQILDRLGDTLADLANPQAREAARNANGLEVLENPRVFLVAGISGGTGSGMVLDMAYAVRQVLTDLHFPSDSLCGLLIHATGYDTTQRDLARINAYATLKELNHFNQPGFAYPGDLLHGIQPAEPGIGPFQDCYLAHLGDQLEEEKAASATDTLAEYLYFNAVPGAGVYLNQFRRETRPPATEAGDRRLRAVGLSSIIFPRYSLAELAGRQLSRQVLMNWQGEVSGLNAASIKAEAQKHASSLGLEVANLTRRFHAAAQKFRNQSSESYLQQILNEAAPNLESNPEASSPEELEKALAKIDDVLGSRKLSSEDVFSKQSPMEIVLKERASSLQETLALEAVHWLTGIIEEPHKRLKGAEVASAALGHHVGFLAEQVQAELEKCQTSREKLRNLLLAQSQPGGKGGNRWLGKGRRSGVVAEAGSRLGDYALGRLRELELANSIAVLRFVARRLAEFNHELNFARQKVQHMLESLDTEFQVIASDSAAALANRAVLLPDQALTLHEAAKKLFASLGPLIVSGFDDKFQAEVLNPQGGLWGFVNAKREVTEAIKEKLQHQAEVVVLHALRNMDAAQLFLLAFPDAGQGKQSLLDALQTAKPRCEDFQCGQYVVVGLPKSPAGTNLRKLMSREVPDLVPTFVESDGDIIFCIEVAPVSIAEQASALIDHEDTYTEIARRVMTRIDIAWVPLSKEIKPT